MPPLPARPALERSWATAPCSRSSLAPARRGADTAGDVAGGLPARRPTLGTGAPAAAVAGVGADRAPAPLEARRRIRRARFGRRLRSVGLASDPRRVGRPLGPGRRDRHRPGPLDAARSFLDAEGIASVELVVDDLFESKLEPRSFDLVHARYQIAPL